LAQQAYADGQRALARGDFAAYGQAQQQVGVDLNHAAQLLGVGVSPTASGSGAPAPSRAPSPSPSP